MINSGITAYSTLAALLLGCCFALDSRRLYDLGKYHELSKCLISLKYTDSSHHGQAQSSCLLDDACTADHPYEERCHLMLDRVNDAFANESSVLVVKHYDCLEHGSYWLKTSLDAAAVKTCAIVVIPKPKVDRSCLLSPPPSGPSTDDIHVLNITKKSSIGHLVADINKLCNTHRDVDGFLTMAGYHRNYILANFYTIDVGSTWMSYKKHGKRLAQCERTTLKSWNQFYMDYLQHSKPVVITNMLTDWPAMNKWTNEYLRHKYANKSVHIKMSPTKDYEGIEPAAWWDNYKTFSIPTAVKEKLSYPDLVVPRPAPVNMNFSQFVDLMENIANGSVTNASAYLEYSSIRNYFPELEEDIDEMPFVKNKLSLKHLNLWLSDGNTVGKLHFDPYDNFLCMIDGRKELILFDPHDNKRLYEAHIPEAEFSVHLPSLTFRRRQLKDSTSMVMSPVELEEPDVDRFPEFVQSKALNCSIAEGEVLYMPAFWWHEVTSSPNRQSNRNLAVNYWYEPFLTKGFPCPECKLDVNPFYNHLL